MTDYVFLHDWKGYKEGQVVGITNSGTARRWSKDGHILLAAHSLLAANMAQPPPMEAGLLYKLAQMNVEQLEGGIAAVFDVELLTVALDNDTRSGAKAALQARLDQLVNL